MVWASALHAVGRGFKSPAGTSPDFFLLGYLLCGSQFMLSKFIVTCWVGKLFLSYSLRAHYFVTINLQKSKYEVINL